MTWLIMQPRRNVTKVTRALYQGEQSFHCRTHCLRLHNSDLFVTMPAYQTLFHPAFTYQNLFTDVGPPDICPQRNNYAMKMFQKIRWLPNFQCLETGLKVQIEHLVNEYKGCQCLQKTLKFCTLSYNFFLQMVGLNPGYVLEN